MNSTPRLRSAFPTTPKYSGRSGGRYGSSTSTPATSSKGQAPMKEAHGTPDLDAPIIPFSVIDAPSQRLYVFAFYVALNGWRLFDYFKLVQDEADSLWLFLKWAFIDGVFVYGLPGMRIPWLEWSSTTTMIIFLLHALIDGVLMFRIPFPIEAWLVAATKILYDRELSVSERRVKPADILHNASLILGKQTIHILPEGSAMLNPDETPFCLGGSKSSASLPILINQTEPILIELLRIDLDTNQNETISIKAKELKALKKQADKGHSRSDTTSPRVLQYSVKSTGMYMLQKVVDESKLEVRRRLSQTLVVACPHALVKASAVDKCKGELSNFALEVHGTPPLKIKYSRNINQEDKGFSFQSIQPENLASPLSRTETSDAIASTKAIDVSWARSQRIEVPLNESLATLGSWLYTIDEVHDAFGNIRKYTHGPDEHEHVRPKDGRIEQAFKVHERPTLNLNHASSQCVLSIGRGDHTALPISIKSTGRENIAPVDISYIFTSEDQLQSNGDHSKDAKATTVSLASSTRPIAIREAGLYTLTGISTRYCSGEVMEPTTCRLIIPSEPDMSISYEKIHDKCAGNSIGLRVNMELTGTPPFEVAYVSSRRGNRHPETHRLVVDGFRHELELRPTDAGDYTYTFKSIQDDLYSHRSLESKNLVLEQDVKPPASAHFSPPNLQRHACLEESVSLDVVLQGEKPWSLEYELVRGSKKVKKKISDIVDEKYTIVTDRLHEGGDYTLALVSVQDKAGCKMFLKEEASIAVRQQRPKASFGQIEGKMSVQILEGNKVALPVRFTGQPPWRVRYRNVEDSGQNVVERIFTSRNDRIEISAQGTYKIVSVQDGQCPGTVDTTVDEFSVTWIERPKMQVADSTSLGFDKRQNVYVKQAVCEEDDDSVEISLTGSAPFHVKYRQRTEVDRAVSVINKEFTAGLGVASIRMDTSKAGNIEYDFSELGDYLYDHKPGQANLKIKQEVYSRPSTRFGSPGKTYRYCKQEEAGDEVIPVKLYGTPPFYLELGIKHHGSTKPELVKVSKITGNSYDVRIPPQALALGYHSVSVRKIRDGHGCQRKTEYDAPSVSVVVADLPSITPDDSRVDYCVGDRISYTLSGIQPFNVFYTFDGGDRKATSTATTFRRIAERPGNFTITGLADSSSDCKAKTKITKIIHEMPSVRISKGQDTVVDIHEGGEAEILFEFWGTPPFEFTYTRSSTARKGHKAKVLETKQAISHSHSMSIKASEEGTYEVVAIKDRYCAFSTQHQGTKRASKLLTL